MSMRDASLYTSLVRTASPPPAEILASKVRMEEKPMSRPLPQLMVSLNLILAPRSVWLMPPMTSSLTWRPRVAFEMPPYAQRAKQQLFVKSKIPTWEELLPASPSSCSAACQTHPDGRSAASRSQWPYPAGAPTQTRTRMPPQTCPARHSCG